MKKELQITDRTVKKFIEYLIGQEKSQSTIKTYQRELFSLQMYLDDSAVTKEKLLNYKAMIKDRYTPSTCNVTIAAVNSFLKFAGRVDLCVKPLKVQKNIYESTDKSLTKRDFDKMVRAAQKSGQERTALIIQTICSTGIRVSELQFITVEALQKGTAQISCKGKNRVVFLPSTLRNLLKRYAEKHNITSGGIFVTRSGKPLDRSNIWKSMKQLCDIAGVKSGKVFPHNLRHLFAKTYYSAEKDISRLADILGHSNVNTTRIYTRETGAVHARQIEALGLVCDTT